MNNLIDELINKLDKNIMWTKDSKKIYLGLNEKYKKEKLIYQLFIGKVSETIGIEKTLELLKESRKEMLNNL